MTARRLTRLRSNSRIQYTASGPRRGSWNSEHTVIAVPAQKLRNDAKKYCHHWPCRSTQSHAGGCKLSIESMLSVKTGRAYITYINNTYNTLHQIGTSTPCLGGHCILR